MIFITPNTIRSPDEMMKSSAAVVTASRATVNMVSPGWCARGRCDWPRASKLSRHCERSEAIQDHARDSGLLRRFAPRNDGLRPSRLRRALCARIDILEALDHAHRAVSLDLAEIHGERGVPLLVHLDRAARPVDGNLFQRLQHLGLVRAAGFLHGGLVG